MSTFVSPDSSNITIDSTSHAVSVMFSPSYAGVGRNAMGWFHLHKAQATAEPAYVHPYTSYKCIRRVFSVCVVTARRRPVQLAISMPLLLLVHVMYVRTGGRILPPVLPAVINVDAVGRYDLVLLVWMCLVDGPIYVHPHPDHYFISHTG